MYSTYRRRRGNPLDRIYFFKTRKNPDKKVKKETDSLSKYDLTTDEIKYFIEGKKKTKAHKSRRENPDKKEYYVGGLFKNH